MFSNIYMLSFLYFLFLLLGGVIFNNTVWEVEEKEIVVEPEQWTRLKAILASPDPAESEDETSGLVAWVLGRCPHLPDDTSLLLTTPGNQSWIESQVEERCPDLRVVLIDKEYVYKWRYVDAVYFSMTVATTIGYGHISPKNVAGRVASILYALVGIPLTGMLLAWTSTFFGEQLFRVFKSKLDKEKQRSKRFIALGTVFYILVGFVVFIFLPAFIFIQIEREWTYFEGVYYAFITLTTIGFGDFVSGTSLEGVWLYVYQFSVIIWIITGLGYWVMVANFITRALKSKKMHSFALKRATDVKQLMKEVGMVQHDPQFLTHTSKATLNFMLQLSSAIVAPELIHQRDQNLNNGGNSPVTPIIGIPGIAALFGKAGMGGVGGNPLFDQFAAGGVFSSMKKSESTSGSKSTLDLPDAPNKSSSQLHIYVEDQNPELSTDATLETSPNINKKIVAYEFHGTSMLDYETEGPVINSIKSKIRKANSVEFSETKSAVPSQCRSRKSESCLTSMATEAKDRNSNTKKSYGSKIKTPIESHQSFDANKNKIQRDIEVKPHQPDKDPFVSQISYKKCCFDS